MMARSYLIYSGRVQINLGHGINTQLGTKRDAYRDTFPASGRLSSNVNG